MYNKDQMKKELSKIQTQILTLVLVLLEIRFVIYLVFYIWSISFEEFVMAGVNIIIAQAALVYLVGIWIKQLNIYYHKKFDK